MVKNHDLRICDSVYFGLRVQELNTETMSYHVPATLEIDIEHQVFPIPECYCCKG